ncbi:MAG TPA: hypothetical protein VFC39_07540 [Acidobacteriaceae bacterium]|nr:hypothetical protein [Acidobacteriaceae bacterium]
MQISTLELKEALRAEREASFFRLRGGYPVALAGAVWWAGMGLAGYRLHTHLQWILLTFYCTALLFPLAILFGRLFRNNFMADRTAVSEVIFPAMGSMLLFWPMAITAFWVCPELVPLILGVGMSIMWPVVGWSYGRTALYSTHAVVRAVVCFVLWRWLPSGRFTVLPLAVSAIYLATVVVLLVASSKSRQPAR